MNNTRNVTVTAIIIVAILAIAGVGYAYTSTTVSTNNTLQTEDVIVKIYSDESATTELYDYSNTDAPKIQYSVYKTSASGERYGVVSDTALTNIKAIRLVSSTNDVSISTLNMYIGNGIEDLIDDEYTNRINVKLTDSNNVVWNGKSTDGIVWTFLNEDDLLIKASNNSGSGIIYSLDISIDADPSTNAVVVEGDDLDVYYPLHSKLQLNNVPIVFKAVVLTTSENNNATNGENGTNNP